MALRAISSAFRSVISGAGVPQSRSRTSLSVVQPLWRGAGVDYGRATERVAENEAAARG